MAQLQELEQKQEQLQEDLRHCGLKEFNDLYVSNLLVQKQIVILQEQENK